MDCCNYVQWRPNHHHHQPVVARPCFYGGAPRFDANAAAPLHQYAQDFPYSAADGCAQRTTSPYDYYRCYGYSGPCYVSPAYPLPDYVYNPKEARIRKAMREANRERSIGASPVVARNEQQRPQIPASEWPHSNQQQMMMPPMLDIQNPEASCNFSMPNHQNQFNHSIGRYNKLHSSSLMQNSSSIPGYAQPSPLAQLQQQTEMWYNYQENMRPRSIGNSFHMPEMNPYSTHPSDAIMQETPTNLVMRSHSNHSSPCCPLTPAPTSSPTIEKNQSLANRKVNDASQNYASKITEIFEQQKELKKSPSPCATDTDMAFMIDESANGDIKEEDVSNLEKLPTNPSTLQPFFNCKPLTKPLPDFKEAFGDTEIGRFLSRPDLQLIFDKKQIDYFDDDKYNVKFNEFIQ